MFRMYKNDAWAAIVRNGRENLRNQKKYFSSNNHALDIYTYSIRYQYNPKGGLGLQTSCLILYSSVESYVDEYIIYFIIYIHYPFIYKKVFSSESLYKSSYAFLARFRSPIYIYSWSFRSFFARPSSLLDVLLTRINCAAMENRVTFFFDLYIYIYIDFSRVYNNDNPHAY